MFKLPWPIEKAEIVEDVTRIRDLPLTFKWKQERQVILWTDDYNTNSCSYKPKPFIVNDSQGAIQNQLQADDCAFAC